MKYGHDIIWKGMIIMRLLINKIKQNTAVQVPQNLVQ